jgi:glucosamine 6-phosphate synthetase-like amidotransferase/phosphosugar isomerase protein
MCGLIGFSGKSNANIDKLKILFMYNLSRGEDSTGYFTYKSGIKKSMLSADKFIKDLYDTGKLFIGHTRKATIGVKNIDNAHPFNFGNLYGVHNGTVKNYVDLKDTLELDDSDVNMDSKVLIAGLAKYKDPRVLSLIDGAAAVLFTEENDKNTLYAYRNSERPLYYGKYKNGLYISSIEESLVAIGCEDVESFEENKLYKITEGEIISVVNVDEYDIVIEGSDDEIKCDVFEYVYIKFDRFIGTHQNTEPLSIRYNEIVPAKITYEGDIYVYYNDGYKKLDSKNIEYISEYIYMKDMMKAVVKKDLNCNNKQVFSKNSVIDVEFDVEQEKFYSGKYSIDPKNLEPLRGNLYDADDASEFYEGLSELVSMISLSPKFLSKIIKL